MHDQVVRVDLPGVVIWLDKHHALTVLRKLGLLEGHQLRSGHTGGQSGPGLPSRQGRLAAWEREAVVLLLAPAGLPGGEGRGEGAPCCPRRCGPRPSPAAARSPPCWPALPPAGPGMPIAIPSPHGCLGRACGEGAGTSRGVLWKRSTALMEAPDSSSHSVTAHAPSRAARCLRRKGITSAASASTLSRRIDSLILQDARASAGLAS